MGGGGWRHDGLYYGQDHSGTRVSSKVVSNNNVDNLFIREKESMIKEEYLEVDGKILTDRKKVRTVRRIQEWEKFEENCLRLKELEKRKNMN